jgi:hypothetical protein
MRETMANRRPKLDAKTLEIFRAFGRAGGKLGGDARAKKLTAEERREIARKAAQTRWRRKRS